MANIFNSVKGLHPRRNSFSAHTYRNDFTALMGLDYPAYIQHVTAATRIRCSVHALVRLQALIAPVMDNIDFYFHAWQLPYRVIENDMFTKFISGEEAPEDYSALFSTPYTLATTTFGELSSFFEDSDDIIDAYAKIFGNGSLLDFCGYDVDLFPTLVYDSVNQTYDFTGGNNWKQFNWRNVIMYYILHLNWYMNENVPYYDDFVTDVNTLVKNQDFGTLCYILAACVGKYGYSLLPHGWDKDYFTSGLPNVQFGDPVSLPIAGNAPIKGELYGAGEITTPLLATNPQLTSGGSINANIVYDGTDPNYPSVMVGNNSSHTVTGISGTTAIELDSESTAYADLSEASAITINELRFANALQVFKERQLRFGRRRIEHYKGFFDVVPEDLRLQVPKYLGGGRIPINISDIEQTSANDGSQVLGSLAGKGTAVAGSFAGFTTFCSEESIIMGIVFAMPHITYSKSVSRFLFKTNDIYDYFNPSFEHLGEQAIENIEIYSGATQDGEFAYTPRYNEYRFHSNEMHGQFKDSLSFWTLGRIFDSQPALNTDFVYMQPKNFNRIFAVSGVDNMLVSMIFNVRVIQPVSKYGTPMLLS